MANLFILLLLASLVGIAYGLFQAIINAINKKKTIKKNAKQIILASTAALIISLIGFDSTYSPSFENIQGEIENFEEQRLIDKDNSETSIGKRSNPVPLGKTITIDTIYYASDTYDEIEGNISVTLSNVIRGEEAYKQLIAYNKFNEKAPKGKEWIIIDVKYKLNKGSEDDPHHTGYFTTISSAGEEVSQDEYAFIDSQDDFGFKELYVGGEISGKVARLVPIGDNALIQLREEQRVFFSIK